MSIKSATQSIGTKAPNPHSHRSTTNLNTLSDSGLYSLCKSLGQRALEARRKFIALLPEIQRRETASHLNIAKKSWLEKRGYSCIYEFAARLGGISREQVNLVLRLEKRFAENLPILHNALINGHISANKLARVASVATPINEKQLLNAAMKISTRALETLVRDMHYAKKCPSETLHAPQCHPQIAPQDHAQIHNDYLGSNCQAGYRSNTDPMPLFDDLLSNNWQSHQQPNTDPTPLRNCLLDDNHPARHQINPNPNQTENQNSLFNAKNSYEDVHVHSKATENSMDVNFHLSQTDLQLFAQFSPQLKENLTKRLKKGVDVNNLLLKLLQSYDQEIQTAKAEIARDIMNKDNEKHLSVNTNKQSKQGSLSETGNTKTQKTDSNALKYQLNKTDSRYIPAKIKKIIKLEHGKTCAVPNCYRPSVVLHHTAHYALTNLHNPYFIAPLCKEHHQLAHLNNATHEKIRINEYG